MISLRSFTFAAVLASGAFAVAEINVAPGRTLAGPGVAVHGYDTVAYFSEGKPVQGSATFSRVYNNATYRFASAENLKALDANRDKNVPAYGGLFAFGVSVGPSSMVIRATGRLSKASSI